MGHKLRLIGHDLVLILQIDLQDPDFLVVQRPEAVQQPTCTRQLLGDVEGALEISPATGRLSSFCTHAAYLRMAMYTCSI